MGQQAGIFPVSHRKGCQNCRAPHQLVVDAVRYRARRNAGPLQTIICSQRNHVQAAWYNLDSLHRQHTTVKACRRESSTLEGRVERCTCLRKLVRRTPIVSEWALQLLHGCSNTLGGRAGSTHKLSPLPAIAAFPIQPLRASMLQEFLTLLAA